MYAQHFLPLLHMDKNTVMELVNKVNTKFQVCYMSNPELNVNRAFKESVENNPAITFEKNNGSYQKIVNER